MSTHHQCNTCGHGSQKHSSCQIPINYLAYESNTRPYRCLFQMFSSKPASFKPSVHCSSPAVRAWCNTRGHGHTTFEHSHDRNVAVHPTHRLEPLTNHQQHCNYLNAQSLTPAPAPHMHNILKASCQHKGAVPKWCVPAHANLTHQEQMFANVKYDDQCGEK